MQNAGYPMVKSKQDRFWSKYCGFLDLPLEQFVKVQEALLLEQLEMLPGTGLGEKLIGSKIPKTVAEFRRNLPLTVYDDYLPMLENRDGGFLPVKPYSWTNASGASGSIRHVPYTKTAYQRQLDNLMSVFVLSCSQERGESALAEADGVLYNVAPYPYLSGLLANGAAQSFNLRSVMAPDV